MMSLTAGQIRIDLSHRSGHVRDVRISSTRSQAATQVLIGKSPEQLLSSVPLLFSLCGNAQAYAALLACRSALDLIDEPDLDAARETLVKLETVREHAWRILLDWPILIGNTPDKAPLAALLKFEAQFKQRLFPDGDAFKLDRRLNADISELHPLITELTALLDSAMFAGRFGEFQSLSDEKQLRAWLSRSAGPAAGLLNELYRRDWLSLGRCNTLPLPIFDLSDLHQTLLQQDLTEFSRVPVWRGQSRDTTPFSRHTAHPLLSDIVSRYGNGLMARFLAMLLEVAKLLGSLASPSAYLADNASFDGVGLATVQAARGLLIHRLVLRQGRVYDYRIVAPTEWNFHPEGVVASSLLALRAGNGECLRKQANWLIQAVDPCVQYELMLTEV